MRRAIGAPGSERDSETLGRAAEIGVVERVNDLIGFPYSLECRQFVGKARGTDRVLIQATRHRFMVDKGSPWFVKRLPAPLVEAQAKVHIVEGNREMTFVKAADGHEPIALHKQARGRHGGSELRQCMTAKIGLLIRVQETMGVARRITDTDHDASMLNTPVGVEQPRADRTDIVASQSGSITSISLLSRQSSRPCACITA